MERRAGYCRTAGTSGRPGPGERANAFSRSLLMPGMLDWYRRWRERCTGSTMASMVSRLRPGMRFAWRVSWLVTGRLGCCIPLHFRRHWSYRAVAESLIDRIGAEIDKRVEAKLGARPQSARSLGEAVPPGGHQALLTGTGIGAGITGLVAIIAEHGSKSVIAPMLVIWVIVAVACLGAAAVNRYRNIRRG
jgi:hypothetical protein